MNRESLPELKRSVRVKIPFHDTDAAGVVWHGNYFKYFELARCELLDAVNYGYRQMSDTGLIWPVVDLQVRFVRSLKFDQEISVTATLVEWQYRLRISYQIHDLDDVLVARGHTDQAPVTESTGEMLIGSPDILLQGVENALAEIADD